MEGIPKGQKILLLQNDYPSINWPVEMRDFDVCYAEIDEHLEKNIEAAVAKHNPDIFMFSIVQWLTGIKIDFQFLKELKSENPDLLLIADGTQYLGTEYFNFAESPIDVLGASAYKWLTAGYGNGFIFIKEAAKQKIHPQTLGFNSALRFESKPEETLFVRYFEPGHQDTLNYGSLENAMNFVEVLGRDTLYRHLSNLSKKAKQEFAETGLLLPSTLNRKEHSSIFNVKGGKVLFQKLQKENIICSPRGGGIRVSFHYYNTEDDLNRFIEVIQNN